MKKLVVLLLAASAAVSGWAQSAQPAPKTVGKLTNVQGLVTVSSGDRLANAVTGAPLIVGNRIVTTSTGEVTLNFDFGCKVTLKANESITVDDKRDCAAMLLAVNPVPVVAAAAVGGSSVVPALIFGGGALAVIIGSNNRTKTSGS